MNQYRNPNFFTQTRSLVFFDLKKGAEGRSEWIAGAFHGFLLSVLLGGGGAVIGVATRDFTRFYPALVWLIFMAASAVTYEQTADEAVGGGSGVVDVLIALGLDADAIYLSRLFTGVVNSCITFGVITVTLALAGNVALPHLVAYSVVAVGVVVAHTSLAVLLQPISRAPGLRLPLVTLISLPLFFPLYLVAVAATELVTASPATVDWTAPPFSFGLTMVALYFVLGLNLFDKALGLPRPHRSSD